MGRKKLRRLKDVLFVEPNEYKIKKISQSQHNHQIYNLKKKSSLANQDDIHDDNQPKMNEKTSIENVDGVGNQNTSLNNNESSIFEHNAFDLFKDFIDFDEKEDQNNEKKSFNDAAANEVFDKFFVTSDDCDFNSDNFDNEVFNFDLNYYNHI